MPLRVACVQTDFDILIVEDDPCIRELLTMLLTDVGYRVQSAGCGAEALRLAHHQRAAFWLLDYHLPDTNGLLLADQLHTLSDTPVSALVLSADLPSPQELLQHHVEGMSKPFDADALLARIQDAFQFSV